MDNEQNEMLGELGEMQNDWENASEYGNEVPPGAYVARIEKMELKRSKSSNKIMLAWTFSITVGDQKGRKLWKNSVLASQDQLSFLKRDLKVVGITLMNIKDLMAEVEYAEGKIVKVASKIDKKGYKVVDLVELVKMDGPETDDLPF